MSSLALRRFWPFRRARARIGVEKRAELATRLLGHWTAGNPQEADHMLAAHAASTVDIIVSKVEELAS